MASKTRRPAAAMAALRDRIRTEGAEAAYEALLRVCRDPKSPAQAASTAGSTLFKSAGLMGAQEDDLDDKPLEAMSFAELQQTIIRGAQAAGAPEDLVDAVERTSNAGLAGPEQEAEAATTRRPRRAARKPAAAKRGPLDDFG